MNTIISKRREEMKYIKIIISKVEKRRNGSNQSYQNAENR
jgi:hypothetical protein